MKSNISDQNGHHLGHLEVTMSQLSRFNRAANGGVNYVIVARNNHAPERPYDVVAVIGGYVPARDYAHQLAAWHSEGKSGYSWVREPLVYDPRRQLFIDVSR